MIEKVVQASRYAFATSPSQRGLGSSLNMRDRSRSCAGGRRDGAPARLAAMGVGIPQSQFLSSLPSSDNLSLSLLSGLVVCPLPYGRMEKSYGKVSQKGLNTEKVSRTATGSHFAVKPLLGEVGPNATSLLPGAISLAETVLRPFW